MPYAFFNKDLWLDILIPGRRRRREARAKQLRYEQQVKENQHNMGIIPKRIKHCSECGELSELCTHCDGCTKGCCICSVVPMPSKNDYISWSVPTTVTFTQATINNQVYINGEQHYIVYPN